MMLAAVETVTKADPVWNSRRHNSDVAAQATARESVHAASPLIKRSESFATNLSEANRQLMHVSDWNAGMHVLEYQG
jgi:Flp pilus assembly protein TadB